MNRNEGFFGKGCSLSCNTDFGSDLLAVSSVLIAVLVMFLMCTPMLALIPIRFIQLLVECGFLNKFEMQM